MKKPLFVYIGTAGTKTKGIYLFSLDVSGKLTSLGLAAEVAKPGFLTIHPNKRFLYSTCNMTGADGNPTGGVASFSINPESGKLTLLNQKPSGGMGSCHVSMDKAGKFVLVANYAAGSTCVLQVLPDGSLGEMTAFFQH